MPSFNGDEVVDRTLFISRVDSVFLCSDHLLAYIERVGQNSAARFLRAIRFSLEDSVDRVDVREIVSQAF